MSDTDLELLARYSRQHAEDAFTELVRRHLGLVHSAALRQVRSPQLAEEIAQSAFMDLARNATKLKPDTILTAWLYQVTRRTAIDVVRREASRQLREQIATEMNAMSATADDWMQVEPLLDDAMHALDETDRAAVLLRYFENKSLRDVGATLGTTENAAGKRINRAVERLREFFAKRGVTVGASGLVVAISANAIQAAPAGLVATITAAALSGAAMTTTAVLAATKGIVMPTLEKTVITLVLLAFLGTATYNAFRGIKQPTESAQAAARDARTESAKPSENQKLPPFVGDSQPTRQVNQGLLRFRVIDEATGAAITNAKLYVTFATNSLGGLRDEVTDSNGEAFLRPPVSVTRGWNYRIETVADGYVPKFVSWSERQNDRVGDMPQEYTLKLAHGATIGGMVVDNQNQPVQGARVVLNVTGEAPGASDDRERLTLMGSYHSEYTDAQGRWRCSHVPSRFGMVYYTVRHRDYLEASFVSNSPDSPAAQRVPFALSLGRVVEGDLVATNALMVLQPGSVLTGIVLDENGFAVQGARITQDRLWGIPEYSVLSGPDGGFRLGNLPAQKLILTVQAENYAPQDMIIDPRQTAEQTRFILTKGTALLGQVTDESGQPIVGASITVARDAPMNNVRFLWKTETDEQGRFQWLTAPATGTEYAVRAAGYENQDRILLKADGTEHALLLRTSSQAGSVRVSGKVLDSRTQQPIPAFRVLLKTSQKYRTDSGAEMISQPDPKVVANGFEGGFNFKVDASVLSSVIEIQADGYWPVRVTNAHPLTADQTLKLEVQPGIPIAGEVHTPDGQPAVDATVVLCSGGALYVRSPRTFDLKLYRNPDSAQTDAAGRFSFQPRLDVRKIAIAHPSGFIEISPEDLGQSQTIRLDPWGRVEGTLEVRGEANAAQTIFLGTPNRHFPITSKMPAVMPGFNLKTDGAGHFFLEGVPPGEFFIAHKANLPPTAFEPMSLSHGQVIQVRAGETTHIILGGTGRAVIGSAVLGNPSAKIDWQHDAQRLSLKLPDPPLPPAPRRPDFTSDEAFSASFLARRANAQQYWNSPEGLAAQRLQHEYILLFEKDGRFHVNDVLPGTYELKIDVTDPTGKDFPRRKILAHLQTTVVVPEAPDGTSGEPFDLGTLLLKVPADQAAKGE